MVFSSFRATTTTETNGRFVAASTLSANRRGVVTPRPVVGLIRPQGRLRE